MDTLTLSEAAELLKLPVEVRPWPDRRSPICGRSYMSVEPPSMRRGHMIRVYEGHCRRHSHAQANRVLEVSEGGILVWMWCIGTIEPGRDGRRRLERRDYVGHRYVFGFDGFSPHRPFIARTTLKAETVRDALDWLKPEPVRQAELAGCPSYRQGDWWFFPVTTKPRCSVRLENAPLWWPPFPGMRYANWGVDNTRFAQVKNHPLVPWTRHRATELQVSTGYKVYVRGTVTAPDHEPLVFDGWHQAVHNRLLAGATTPSAGPNAGLSRRPGLID